MFALIALLPAALAGDPVLHLASGVEALTAVSEVADVPDASLVPLRLDALLPGSPTVVGAAQPRPCAGPPTTAAALWDTVTNRAEPRVLRQDYAEAVAMLDGVVASLACLDAPVERTLGVQVHFLRGIATAALGDSRAAEADFARVLDYDRAAAWPSRHADDARPVFEAVAARPRPESSVWIAPDVAGGGALFVDGNLAPGPRLRLPAGEHLLQVVGARTLTLPLRADPIRPVAVVADPAALLAAVDQPEAAGALATLALTRVPDATHVYAWVDGAVWRGPGEWARLGTYVPAPASRAAFGRDLRLVGLTVASVGAVGALAGGGWSLATRGATVEGTDEAYWQAHGAWRDRQVWTIGSAGLAGVGLALTGVGMMFGSPVALTPWGVSWSTPL